MAEEPRRREVDTEEGAHRATLAHTEHRVWVSQVGANRPDTRRDLGQPLHSKAGKWQSPQGVSLGASPGAGPSPEAVTSGSRGTGPEAWCSGATRYGHKNGRRLASGWSFDFLFKEDVFTLWVIPLMVAIGL